MPATIHPARRKLTVPTVARRLGVSTDKVRHWIRIGELAAIDLARQAGNRPRYSIDIDDLAAFERRRRVAPTTPPATQRRRRKQAGVTEYF